MSVMTRRPARAHLQSASIPRLLAIILAPILLNGCYAGYLARAAYEEGRILWNRKPIDDALARADLPADVREKLETVLAVRKFAADKLGLNLRRATRSSPTHGGFRSSAAFRIAAISTRAMRTPRRRRSRPRVSTRWCGRRS